MIKRSVVVRDNARKDIADCGSARGYALGFLWVTSVCREGIGS